MVPRPTSAPPTTASADGRRVPVSGRTAPSHDEARVGVAAATGAGDVGGASDADGALVDEPAPRRRVVVPTTGLPSLVIVMAEGATTASGTRRIVTTADRRAP